MFTGIIEKMAEVVSLTKDEGNLHICCKSDITKELKIDQSISHNGVCLTVVDINNDLYTVTAVQETLKKTNLSKLKLGDLINIERSMRTDGRFDGHIVQGHVDQTAVCIKIIEEKGSHVFAFKHNSSENITVEKGSISVNGVSLTVVNSKDVEFSVVIIPYTFQHTNFKHLKIGDIVNIEFDILGKYVSKMFFRDL